MHVLFVRIFFVLYSFEVRKAFIARNEADPPDHHSDRSITERLKTTSFPYSSASGLGTFARRMASSESTSLSIKSLSRLSL